MAVGDDPPVSVDVDVNADAVDVPNVTNTSAETEEPPAWQPKAAARAAHEAVNSERDAAGRGALSWSDDIAAPARDYAQQLAKADTLSHTLDGRSAEDRYYGDGIVAFNGENIHQTWWREEITVSESENIGFIDSAADLGRSIVNSWMTSDGHRENILDTTNRAEGIGVAKNEMDKIYSVQVFSR
jgi:Uncharacterized protein with SCP/PR1 domains